MVGPMQMLAMAGLVTAWVQAQRRPPRLAWGLLAAGVVAAIGRATLDAGARPVALLAIAAASVLTIGARRRPVAGLVLLPWSGALLDDQATVPLLAWMAAGIHSAGAFRGPSPVMRPLVAAGAAFILIGCPQAADWATRTAAVWLGLLLLLDAWPDGLPVVAAARSIDERLGRLLLGVVSLVALTGPVGVTQPQPGLWVAGLTPAAVALFLLAGVRATRSRGWDAALVDAAVAATGGLLLAATLAESMRPPGPRPLLIGAALLSTAGLIWSARSRWSLMLLLPVLPSGLLWWTGLAAVPSWSATSTIDLPGLDPQPGRLVLLIAGLVLFGPLLIVPAAMRGVDRSVPTRPE